MVTVKRYECDINGNEYEDATGSYVRASDYDALAARLAEVERLVADPNLTDGQTVERLAVLFGLATDCAACGGTGRHVRGHGQEWTCEVCHGTGRAPP